MKKLKAIFLCENDTKIDYVYSPEQQKLIAELTDLIPERLCSRNFDSMDLSELEVIFSTWGMMCFSEEQLAKMPKLKAVFYAAGATDSFARPLLNHGIKLVSAWRANAIPVAEFTVAQIILSMKNYFANSSAVTGPDGWKQDNAGPGCYGETVALIGAGAISNKVQELLKNFKLNVIVVPSRPERRTISLEEVFQKVDALLTPVAPTPAFRIGELQDPLTMYLNDLFTIPSALAGNCAMSVPAGFTNDTKMPVGVQFICDAFREDRLLAIGRAFEEARG